MEWKLFANFAEATGSRTVAVDPGPDATVGDALDALVAAHPDLEPLVFESDAVRGHVTLMRNGRPASVDDPADPGDELAAFPPVSGG
jgi:molybdopterin synthase sulfur carrier subunit